MDGSRKGMPAALGLLALLTVLCCATPAVAEVNVNIRIGPPAVVVAGPPEMIVVPHTMVYFAPDVEGGLLFHAGFWWAPNQGRWFRAKGYNGPWVIVEQRHVPVEIVRLPRDYRRVYVSHKRIPYGQLKKHRERRELDRRERRGEWKDWKEEKRDRKEEHKERKEERRERGGKGHK